MRPFAALLNHELEWATYELQRATVGLHSFLNPPMLNPLFLIFYGAEFCLTHCTLNSNERRYNSVVNKCVSVIIELYPEKVPSYLMEINVFQQS